MLNTGLDRSRRALLALLALAALLAGCAPLASEPTPAPTVIPTRPPSPSPAPKPTTVEVDPTETPAPAPTPAPIGDCPATFGALDAVDQAMFANISSIQGTFVNNRFTIWDNEYRFDDIPMMLARRDRSGVPPRYGFLINWSTGILENGGKIKLPTYLDLGTVYCVSPLAHAQDVANAPYLLRQPLHADSIPITITTPSGRQTDDDSVFLLVYGDRSQEARAEDRASDPRATDRWTSYAVREVFHRWQTVEGPLEEHFRLVEWDSSARNEPLTKEQVALALLEQRILAAALRSAGADERLLREFIAVRQSRLSRADAPLAEQAQEQRDGTAEYVAYRFATAAGQIQLQSWPERLLAAYAGARPPEPGDGAPPLDRYVREQRPSLTGAALGLLMDAAAIPWRQRMAEGKTPFEVLATALPIKDDEREALAQAAKERFGYAELETRAEAALAALK